MSARTLNAAYRYPMHTLSKGYCDLLLWLSKQGEGEGKAEGEREEQKKAKAEAKEKSKREIVIFARKFRARKCTSLALHGLRRKEAFLSHRANWQTSMQKGNGSNNPRGVA
nr:MAG TPA: hypothetical protein [Caudoviricetes sp.]